MNDAEQEIAKCGAKKKESRGGGTCQLPAGHGTPHPGVGPCKYHMGCTPAVVKSAMQKYARLAVETYGLSREIDPRDALLEEVWRTAGAIDWIQKKIKDLDPDALVWGITEFKTGYQGDDSISVKTETATINVWVDLYQRERAHLVAVSKAAIGAGIEERRVRLAEQQGQLLGNAIRAILGDLQLTPEQETLVGTVVPQRLRELSASAYASN
jgi:hypothetical protein